MLNPYRGQVDRSSTQVGFTKEERKGPFTIKPEHATVCQHDSNRELGQIKVSRTYSKFLYSTRLEMKKGFKILQALRDREILGLGLTIAR